MLDELLKSPETTLIPFWRDHCLVSGDPPVPVTLHAARADGAVFLGLDADGHGVFATDLSGMKTEQAAKLCGADRAVDVRVIVGTLSPAEAATAGYGRGLLHWHRNRRFCGSCGAVTESVWGGHQRVCGNEACGRGIRTRGLLLPNQLLLAARHRPTRLHVASTCEDSRSMPLEAAWLRCLLAPTLAPMHISIGAIMRTVLILTVCL
jgi:hypothetical protein